MACVKGSILINVSSFDHCNHGCIIWINFKIMYADDLAVVADERI